MITIRHSSFFCSPGLLNSEERIAKQEKYLTTYQNTGLDTEGAGQQVSNKRDSYISNSNGYTMEDKNVYEDAGSYSDSGSNINESSETGEKERQTSLIY